MKKTLFGWLALAALLIPTSASAADHSSAPDRYFLNEDEVPGILTILPPPPAENSARFAYDREQYEWGKTIRDTERGKVAISDADLSYGWIDRAFSEAYGSPITPDAAPLLCRLLYKMQEDAGDLGTRAAKNHYMRTRPFVYWNEPTSTPGDEVYLKGNGSYPSGHTSIGWATALVLAEIRPERATEILDRGFQFGQSRVIVGAHYQSDVDAGRVAGAGVVARLHADPAFAALLDEVKKEQASGKK